MAMKAVEIIAMDFNGADVEGMTLRAGSTDVELHKGLIVIAEPTRYHARSRL